VSRKRLYLSHILDESTPTYGNANRFVLEKKSDITKGDVANNTTVTTTVHIGTHLDMPYHFYEEGQTVESFDVDYFSSEQVLFVELVPEGRIIKDELIRFLERIENKETYEFLIVKTGICRHRNEEMFWRNNYGFDPSLADYLRRNFPGIRIFGFDSISVSSFENRMLGREAHRAFLDPKNPILILEDMNLCALDTESKIIRMDIVPLRIAKCDGLPCTVIAEVEK
jgi:kynurenine formamidase